MAYCERCGAYIPDGKTKCLACGFEPSARRQYDAGAATAYQQQTQQDEARIREEERRLGEEERRRQEEERQRRREEYRRNAEAEFARRQAEQREREQQAWSRANSHPYSQSGRVNSRQTKDKSKSRFLSALSYLGILWFLPYVSCPEDRFARFHARQGLALFIFELAAGFIGKLFSVGWLLNLFTLYCIYKGMMGALNGKTEELPVIGKFANPEE